MLTSKKEAQPSRRALFALALAFAVFAPVAAAQPVGAVWTMSNEEAGNRILMSFRNADGSLIPGPSYDTGGLGSGGSLGNQNGLILTQNEEFLIAVNAGSNDISVFRVRPDSLIFIVKVPSQGLQPISLATFGDLIYVLNAGGQVGDQDSIAGFLLTQTGLPLPIGNSVRPLSEAVTNPAQIEFTANGQRLVVTEKATNRILVFTMFAARPSAEPRITNSIGQTPFGFAFGKRDQLYVSEANGGAANGSTLTSYVLRLNGSLTPLTPAAPSFETAACWVVVSPDGRLAFVSNTGSDSVSTYSVGFDGQLSLLQQQAAATAPGPLDMALTADGQFLYVLDGAGGVIGDYIVEEDGSLTGIPGAINVPTSANGLAVR